VGDFVQPLEFDQGEKVGRTILALLYKPDVVLTDKVIDSVEQAGIVGRDE